MKYLVKQKSKTIWKEGFYIHNEEGARCYFVKAQNLGLSQVSIYDVNQNELLKIHKKLFRYDVFDTKNELLFSIKSNFGFKKKHFYLVSQLDDLKNVRIEGNYVASNFDIYRPEEILAQVSKKIVHVFDSYCCEIIDKKNEVNYIAMAMIVDLAIHKE
ncbi:MAG TPA: LURP-one-related family protein [Clostridia bacterium]